MRPVLAVSVLLGVLAGMWYLVRTSGLVSADEAALGRQLFVRIGSFSPVVQVPMAPVDARRKVCRTGCFSSQ